MSGDHGNIPTCHVAPFETLWGQLKGCTLHFSRLRAKASLPIIINKTVQKMPNRHCNNTLGNLYRMNLTVKSLSVYDTLYATYKISRHKFRSTVYTSLKCLALDHWKQHWHISEGQTGGVLKSKIFHNWLQLHLPTPWSHTCIFSWGKSTVNDPAVWHWRLAASKDTG